MTKVRRQKKRKTYQYNVNRKRLNKKQCSGTEMSIVKNSWTLFKSTKKNFKKNGLIYDVNQDIKSLNKQNGQYGVKEVIPMTDLVSHLEETANVVERKQSNMSKDQIEYLAYMSNKYGENYKEMAKDRRNYLQHTWKQLRSKIKAYKTRIRRNTKK